MLHLEGDEIKTGWRQSWGEMKTGKGRVRSDDGDEHGDEHGNEHGDEDGHGDRGGKGHGGKREERTKTRGDETTEMRRRR